MTSYARDWKAADMSLRDYFAAQAITAAVNYAGTSEDIATIAYEIADDLLRQKTEPPLPMLEPKEIKP